MTGNGETGAGSASCRLSLEDLQTAYATERSWAATIRAGRMMRILGPAVLAAIVWLLLTGRGVPFPLWLVLALTVVAIVSPLAPGYLARRHFRRGSLLHTFNVDDAGVSTEAGGRVYRLRWEQIAVFDEGEDWAWIYPAKGAGIFLPKQILGEQALAILADRIDRQAPASSAEQLRKQHIKLLLWLLVIGAAAAYFVLTGQSPGSR